jgi:glucoamylase
MMAANLSTSLSPTAWASDGNSSEQVIVPNGDVYFHRDNHDNYGESNGDCSGFPYAKADDFGRAVASTFRRTRRV